LKQTQSDVKVTKHTIQFAIDDEEDDEVENASQQVLP